VTPKKGSSKIARFIVFEGLDGAGTTTQSQLLHQELVARGTPSALTSEPTTGPIGRVVREYLSGINAIDPRTIAHLFAADRCEHLYGESGILEEAESGKVVICDRYKYSSLAYQSVQAGESLVRALNEAFPEPAAVIYLRVDPETAEQRLARRTSREIYEVIEFQRRVALNYALHMKEAMSRTTVIEIDGHQSAPEIAKSILEELSAKSILEP
jgi:dTMP kinase